MPTSTQTPTTVEAVDSLREYQHNLWCELEIAVDRLDDTESFVNLASEDYMKSLVADDGFDELLAMGRAVYEAEYEVHETITSVMRQLDSNAIVDTFERATSGNDARLVLDRLSFEIEGRIMQGNSADDILDSALRMIHAVLMSGETAYTATIEALNL